MVVAAVVVVVAVVSVLIRHNATDPPVAQTTGSGVAATQARPLPPFSSVDVAVGGTIRIYEAAKPVAVVRTDENLVDRITTRVRDHVLIVQGVGHFTTRIPLTVVIGAPHVAGVTLSGGGSVRLQNLTSSRLAVTLSGLGGSLTASGAVGRLDVELRSFGDAQLRSLTARDVHAVLGGSGRIVVTATRTLDATMSGSGAIVYYGDPPQVHKRVTGSGSVSAG